jgi:hypothetical protein
MAFGRLASSAGVYFRRFPADAVGAVSM